MKWMIFAFAFVLFFGMASATVSEVVLIDDIGSFGGAILKIKSPISGVIGDKIYASEYLTDVGIIKFNIETSLKEAVLIFIITKDGNVVDEFMEGPFVINGSEILIDRREEVLNDDVSFDDEVSSEEVSLDLEVSLSNSSNDTLSSEEVPSPVVTGEEAIVVEDIENVSKGDSFNILLTGRAVFLNEDGSFDFGSFAGGGFFILIFVVFIVMMHRREKEVGEVLSEDDKELAYMEKKVKATEDNISKIRNDRARREKLVVAKARLAKGRAELSELEKKERTRSGQVEYL